MIQFNLNSLSGFAEAISDDPWTLHLKLTGYKKDDHWRHTSFMVGIENEHYIDFDLCPWWVPV